MRPGFFERIEVHKPSILLRPAGRSARLSRDRRWSILRPLVPAHFQFKMGQDGLLLRGTEGMEGGIAD
ncbi:MAG: hypothetical protein A2Z37_11720 [Chloroflexi bacterium RBG_19FT_COMBO_62_14]|nr:MAG: hypothetical protein A2Z37_11720 [Chloroflexi bacterium RBG_19FT_COMBO_62_14]